MFALYKELLPQLGGYLTHAGELSRGRLETFMRHLASAEADVLHARAEVRRWPAEYCCACRQGMVS